MPLRQNQLQSTPQQISADTKIPDMEKIWNDLGNSEANQARIARNSFPRHCLVKSAPPICKVRYIRKAHAQVHISTPCRHGKANIPAAKGTLYLGKNVFKVVGHDPKGDHPKEENIYHLAWLAE